MNAPVRVALVGAGYIADWHARALATVPHARLAAICDLNRSRAAALAARHGVAAVHGSLDELIAAGNIDAVHILTPPELHFNAAQQALNAGLHVLLEKPMCAEPDDCDLLVALAGQRGLQFAVGHNFLFTPGYEQVRAAVRNGELGRLDQLHVRWNRFLPQSHFGPFDIWMLRDPRNILLEIGAHTVAHMLDLVGQPASIEALASNPITLPTGVEFYRRWELRGSVGATRVHLDFSFVPAFAEFELHARGSLGAATVDFERSTAHMQRTPAADPDFAVHQQVTAAARTLRQQARQTLSRYMLSKLKLEKRGNPYGASIARAMDAFYLSISSGAPLDERLSPRLGARAIRLCHQLGRQALPNVTAPLSAQTNASPAQPTILVLGGTGFIGRELVRQLVAAGHKPRLLARGLGSLPASLRAQCDCMRGDLANAEDVRRALDGISTVFHLARAQVKSWADYQQFEIAPTRQLAELAIQAGVSHFIYTGTIDSYDAGNSSTVLTGASPLDPRVERRNLYARAKAESEAHLCALARDKGLPLTILRPGIVIGRGGSPFHWGVGMWWADAVCQIWGEGRNKLPLVLVEDVARALVLSLGRTDLVGRAFNLVGPPLLTAHEYLDALDDAGSFRLHRQPTPIWKFYLGDMIKWCVKVAVRHPERRLPSYHDWQSRRQLAQFDCQDAAAALGWQPVADRDQLIEAGIRLPLNEYLH